MESNPLFKLQTMARSANRLLKSDSSRQRQESIVAVVLRPLKDNQRGTGLNGSKPSTLSSVSSYAD
jgi:hypothetical protein